MVHGDELWPACRGFFINAELSTGRLGSLAANVDFLSHVLWLEIGNLHVRCWRTHLSKADLLVS